MSKKKILIIKPLIPKYDLEFYRKLSNQEEYEIHVTANIKTNNQLNLKSYDNETFYIHHTDIIKKGPFLYTRKLVKVINEIKPDLVIFSSNPRDISLLYILPLCRFIYGYKTACWSMFHRIGGPIVYSSLFHKVIGLISNRNMSYTNIGKLYQIARGINPDKIDVIGTAIDEKEVLKYKSSVNINLVEELKNKYNLNDKFTLLQVMRLSVIKRPHLLVDMMELLVQHEKEAVLVLIGGGELENEIIEYTKSKQLQDNIIFIGPLYSEGELSCWFELSEIFVVPTCIGLSAHHAFAYGLPIVTDNSLKNQASEFDILSDGLNCLLYDENCMESFVEKILKLKNDKNLYKKISENALLTVKEIYSMENKVKNFLVSLDKNFHILKQGDI
ncbi:glycosyltransferase family 4 protein [Aliarcobacter skirrowii]|uniref:glycosyltransferase family 4 protein n=1 Tax=Aliarcobacter skirrowii TaxID=28200 RepID=UPI0029BA0156|nr:glycosyltransferase family 4 protein [Aliarcobacter skirrowii]MDX4036787.1 glycosyltransferase family 4 protein [Aliarcobacter skirrowii]